MASSAQYVRALKVPLALLGIAATALVAYYWVYVQGQADYLTSRNFRMLSAASQRLEESLENAHEVVGYLSRADVPGGPGGSKGTGNKLEEARRSKVVPILSLVTAGLPPGAPSGPQAPAFVDATSTRWAIHASSEPAEARVPVDLDGLVRPLLAPYMRRDVFDSVVLATAGGRVLLQMGDPTLRLASLAGLRPAEAADTKAAAPPSPGAVAQAADVFEVEIAEARFLAFVQPCCATVQTLDGKERGWVVAGLVSRAGFRSASLSVSFSLLALLMGLLLLAAFSWPFAKLLLIGPLQRVRFADVLLVGFCTVLGGALVTIATLDYYAYSRLKADLDEQLEAYAGQIARNVSRELNAATGQLEELARAYPSLREPELANVAAKLRLRRYPSFESFVLIDGDGQQQVKWARGDFVTPRISVAGRAYFTHWRTADPNERRFVDSIRSRTTGNPELVVSKRSHHPGLPVASLSTSAFHSLMDTVTVPGFGFAVVDPEGRLLFGSQPEHDVSDDFFAETDRNRRLRALIAARQKGWLTLQYGGNSYRAYATPMAEQDWSLVTFFDKKLARTVNVDWLILATVFVGIYVGIYALIVVAIHVARPSYRAPWVWLSVERRRVYVPLACVLGVLGLGWLVAFRVLSDAEMLWTAWLLPFVAWFIAYGYLATPRAARSRRIAMGVLGGLLVIGWSIAVHRCWIVIACVVLAAVPWSLRAARIRIRAVETLPVAKLFYGSAALAMGALTIVLPAAAFYQVAHRIQTVGFVKYAQLGLAVAAEEREARGREITNRHDAGDPEGRRAARARFDRLGVYTRFFYDTTSSASGAGCGQDARATNDALEPFAESLPFYSELSVGIRELAHDRAADGKWQWCVRDGSLVLSLTRPSGTVTYVSRLPPLLGTSPRWPAWTEALAILGGVLALAAFLLWTVRFFMQRLLLVDLVDPLWTPRTKAPPASGVNLLMVSRGPLAAPFFDLAQYVVIDLGTAGADPDAWERAGRTSVGQSEDWKPVLVLRFERAALDGRLSAATLRLLEYACDVLNRTVHLVSAQPPWLLARIEGPAPADPEWPKRWQRLLATFMPVPVGATAPGSIAPPTWADAQKGSQAGRLLWRLNMGFLGDEASDVYVQNTWSLLVPSTNTPLDASQLLVEADERLERYYRRIWNACSADEQLVLLQIAEEGLCNQKSTRIARRLMARGLVTHRPNIRLATETFRRFVISEHVRAEAVSREGQSTSAWDQVRLPFLAVLVAALAFFFTTQKDLYNATLGVVAALAAAVPTVLKLVSLFGEKRAATS